MSLVQDLIHKTEVGGGMRYLKVTLAVLAFAMLWVGYNWRDFTNMASCEAMDSAQVARNIAQGKGFTTLFIRPFSMYLVKKHNPSAAGSDAARIKEMHPDLANPPVYPLMLAGLMKVLPFHYAIPAKPQPFWSSDGRFLRYQPDFLIALFNQILFFGVVVLVFLLAKRWFEPMVAWLSGVLLLCTEVLWRFSVSGLSTMLLLLIFTGLIWCLVFFEEEGRQFPQRLSRLIVLAVLAGGLCGVGAMTRYSFGWVILPVLLFVLFFAGEQRVIIAIIALVAFAAVMAPWVSRNFHVSGTPFGTASFAAVEDSIAYPGNRLERTLEPDFNRAFSTALSRKLMVNTREIVQNDLPRLGGGWISAFFLVGLLVGYRAPSVVRLRYFLVGCVVVFVIAQALGKTHLSEESPEINSENLLVLAAPLVLLYGVSLFHFLLGQIEMPMREMRYAAIGIFGALVCLPMIFAFLPPKTIPIIYPPSIPVGRPAYFPPSIQGAASMVKEKELTMSDIPWAMAWYGQSQSVWLTLNAQSDFLAINDYQKPIQELYLTRVTIDSRFLSDWIMGAELSWGTFVLECTVRIGQRLPPAPPSFPLHYWQAGWPEQILLTAREPVTKLP